MHGEDLSFARWQLKWGCASNAPMSSAESAGTQNMESRSRSLAASLAAERACSCRIYSCPSICRHISLLLTDTEELKQAWLLYVWQTDHKDPSHRWPFSCTGLEHQTFLTVLEPGCFPEMQPSLCLNCWEGLSVCALVMSSWVITSETLILSLWWNAVHAGLSPRGPPLEETDLNPDYMSFML